MQSLAAFIAAHGLTMEARRRTRNPNMTPSPHMTRHFLCIITAPDKTCMEVPFSQGSAHTQPPTLADVLDCLASDASSVVNAKDFADWAGDMGWSDDSIKALRTYETCLEQADELKRFLTPPAFEALLYSTERE